MRGCAHAAVRRLACFVRPREASNGAVLAAGVSDVFQNEGNGMMQSGYAAPLFIVIAVLVGSCASPAPLPQEVTSSIKRFGVVSVSADTFTRQYVGLVVFTNEVDRKDIAAWELDNTYAEQVGQTASAMLRAVYVPAPYSTSEFSKVNDVNGIPNWAKIEEAAKGYCGANRLDAILVLAKQKRTSPGIPMELASLGILSRITWANLYYSAQVGLLDCATGKLLASRVVDSGGDLRIPWIALPREVGAQPVAQWDATTEADIKSKLTGLPSSAWDRTLRTLIAAPKQ